jgi:hypothetical protein
VVARDRYRVNKYRIRVSNRYRILTFPSGGGATKTHISNTNTNQRATPKLKQRTTTSTTKERERESGEEIMLAPEDENEADVRREDQDRINQFARLNARRHDNTMEREQIKVTIYIYDILC